MIDLQDIRDAADTGAANHLALLFLCERMEEVHKQLTEDGNTLYGRVIGINQQLSYDRVYGPSAESGGRDPEPTLKAHVKRLLEQLRDNQLGEEGSIEATFRELMLDRLSDVVIYLRRINDEMEIGSVMEAILDEAVEEGVLEADTLEDLAMCEEFHPDEPVYCQKTEAHDDVHRAVIGAGPETRVVEWR